MANIEVPGWQKAMYSKDWATLNRIVIRDCNGAAKGLRQAWGKGGSHGVKAVGTWDGWFENLYCRIQDLSLMHQLDRKLSPEAETAALSACAQVLTVRCPHWDHVDNIMALRSLFRPAQAFHDYPVNTADSDDDEPM